MRLNLALLCCSCLLLISGCADSVSFEAAAEMESVGFWYGLWHGLILPISFIVSLFSESTAIYATYNNGGWYDLGFVLGVSMTFGGSGSASS